ncbi:MAG: DNA repair protein RadC [Polyangia bacterium]|nr:DNA repair protein RadC [Polyangia bacterium]
MVPPLRLIQTPRPVDRLRSQGPGALSDEELLSLVLGHGPKVEDVLEVARELLTAAGNLAGLCGLEAAELARHPGVGPAKGARIVAAMELGKRALCAGQGPSPLLAKASDVYSLMLPHVAGLAQETFWALSLNVRHRLRKIHQVAAGSLASVMVHPREVFGPLLRQGAAATILVHNHPSGDPEPSRDDLTLTRRLVQIGELTGIPVLDHLVIAQGAYSSLAEKGLL